MRKETNKKSFIKPNYWPFNYNRLPVIAIDPANRECEV